MSDARSRPSAPESNRAKAEHAVRLEGVSKAFGARRVLDDVSFEVPAGCGFIILGRSGTGKSVTLRHIVRLVVPDRGRVFVGDDEISGLSGAELSRVRRRIGFLFQNAALFDSISVGENVAFPLRRHSRLSNREIRDRAAEKLEAVGLGSEYDKMPAALSGGMRKRAGLARAMALDPPVLLVDEPSAGLLEPEQQVGGTTLIAVTHDISSARKLGDTLLMLHEGRVVANGTPADLERSSDPMVQSFMSSRHSG